MGGRRQPAGGTLPEQAGNAELSGGVITGLPMLNQATRLGVELERQPPCAISPVTIPCMPRVSHVRRLILPLALACGGSDATPDEEGVVLQPLSASLAGETVGMRSPESVRYDDDLDVFYISNIDGDPAGRDGRAFIAVVPAETLSVMRVLAEGGRGGVTLNAPKGMALTGDTLWITDIDVVRGLHRRTGAAVVTIDFAPQGAVFLNDIAVGPNGALYVTDSNIRIASDGSMTKPGMDRIFRISNRVVSEVARGAAFGTPDGMTWQDTTGVWLLAPFASAEVQTWIEGDSLPGTLAAGPGQYGGIEALRDGRILVSSHADSAVHLITHGEMTTLIANVRGPGDIGYDPKRGVIAVPRVMDNKVDYFQLKAGR